MGGFTARELAGLTLPEPVPVELGATSKFQVWLVGAPVELLVKLTTRLDQPDCGDPTNFATAGHQDRRAATGNRGDDAFLDRVGRSALTRIVPPRTLAMIGVMRLNWQLSPTVTGAPSSVPGVEDWIGERVGQRPVDEAGVVLDLPPILPALGGVAGGAPGGRVLRGEVGRDPREVLQVHLAEIDPPEVERHQHQEEQDREDEREFDHALATRTLAATAHD